MTENRNIYIFLGGYCWRVNRIKAKEIGFTLTKARNKISSPTKDTLFLLEEIKRKVRKEGKNI